MGSTASKACGAPVEESVPKAVAPGHCLGLKTSFEAGCTVANLSR